MRGDEIYNLMEKLWPICRSITGDGVRETLNIIKNQINDLKIIEVPSGTKCFDWKIPKEWNVKDAYVIDPDGKKIIDFKQSNLHLVNYSISINREMDLEELNKNLYSLPKQPNAIPYVTSYYKDDWGFCIQDHKRRNLKKGKYKVMIDSNHKNGFLTYGELFIKGEIEKEIFISTYICHPSMANNELSGPCLTTFISDYILRKKNKFSYRIIFIPETIGSIYYLSKNLNDLKKNIIAGFNINCVGDNKNWSFLASKDGNNYCDNLSRRVLKKLKIKYKEYSFLERGSDERQYCSPGVDLPVCSIMRSKYNTYDEYHTSFDNLDFVSSDGLNDSFNVYKEVLNSIEKDNFPKAKILAEPMMSKRGLRPTIGIRGSADFSKDLMNFLIYSDGKNSLTDISEKIKISKNRASLIMEDLLKLDLISIY
jgi:aminopeptidase-like protein